MVKSILLVKSLNIPNCKPEIMDVIRSIQQVIVASEYSEDADYPDYKVAIVQEY